MNKNVLTWLYRAAGSLLAVSYLMVIITLGMTGLLPALYLILIIAVTAPLVAWLAVTVFKGTKKKSVKKRNIATGGALILSVVALYAFVSLFTTASFLADLAKSGNTYDTYSVIAKKDRKVKLSDAKKVALRTADANKEAVGQELKKLTPAEQVSVDSLTGIKTSLNGNATELGTVRDTQLDLMKESDPHFYDSVEVLAHFKVKSSSSTITSTVNVNKPFALYISGIDSYGEIASVSRSDVNMLAIVNPQQRKILLVNTPRDYYVQLHDTQGEQRDKLTHAGVYGVDMSIQTMQDLYGIKIDSYARVNFDTLIKIVDTLGGVEVYSDQAFKSFKEGYNSLNGKQALEFSRERYSFSEGDRMRGKNQQRVIEAILAKLNNPSTLAHYSSILNTVKSSLETNMSGDVIAALVNKQLQNPGSRWSTESISVDGTGKLAPTYSMGDLPLYVMEPDTASVNAAKAKISTYLGRSQR